MRQSSVLISLFLALMGVCSSLRAQQQPNPASERGSGLSWGRPLLPLDSSVVTDDSGDERASTVPERIPLVLRARQHFVDVIGGLASVQLVQEFVNDSDYSLEVTLAYALPKGAAVHAMRVVIGDRLLEGQIREREEARRELKTARASGRRAAVVERAASGVFRTQVTNVQPGDVLAVELSYDMVVPYEDGRFRLRIPLGPAPHSSTAGARSAHVSDLSLVTDGEGSAEALLDELELTLVKGLPIVEVESGSHELLFLESESGTVIQAAGPGKATSQDFMLDYTLGLGDDVTAATWISPARDGFRELMALVVPPVKADEGSWRRPTEVLFIIDSSGSMSGGSLVAARLALDTCLQALRPEDRFNVVRYSSTHELLAPESLPASQDFIARARSKVASLRAGGGTQLEPALKAALRTPASSEHLRLVILLTDGHVGAPVAVLNLLDSELAEARLFVLGIGDTPNAQLVREMASRGRGTAHFIQGGEQVEATLVSLFERIGTPVAWDLSLDWAGLEVDGVYPEYLPDVYAGQPVTFFARFRDEGPFNFELLSETQAGFVGYPLVINPTTATPHPAVSKLWARAHLNRIEKGMRKAQDEEGRGWWREELLDHALSYGLVTSVTSFLVVEAVPAAAAGPERHLQAMRAGAYPTTATRHPRLAVLGLLVLLLGCGLRGWDWFLVRVRAVRRRVREGVSP